MYLDFEVPIPSVPGKINTAKEGGTTYVKYVAGRKYISERKYNIPDQKIIGKIKDTDPTMIVYFSLSVPRARRIKATVPEK